VRKSETLKGRDEKVGVWRRKEVGESSSRKGRKTDPARINAEVKVDVRKQRRRDELYPRTGLEEAERSSYGWGQKGECEKDLSYETGR